MVTEVESQQLEYKFSLRVKITGELYKPLETARLKTIAAFTNSRDGGTLLIGVGDDGSVCGLANDYASLRKPGKDDRDLFQLHFGGIIAASMGAAAAANVSSYIHTIDEADVCRVHVHASGFPVDARVTVDKNGQMIKKTRFMCEPATPRENSKTGRRSNTSSDAGPPDLLPLESKLDSFCRAPG